jgi:hypothetical protein
MMMPNSPEVMWVQHQIDQAPRRPVNPDERERPMRRRERMPDPIGVQMARIDVDALAEDVDQRIDRGRGRLREALAAIMRRLPAGPFSTAPGER